MPATPSNTPEETAVIVALGESGQKIVDLFRAQMNTNAEELRAATNRYNDYVKEAKARDGDNTETLTRLRDALNHALNTHTTTATALNDQQQVTPAEVAEVVRTTEVVHELEDSWKAQVDEDIKSLKTRVKALEDSKPIPTPALVPTPEPAAEPTNHVDVIENRMVATPARPWYYTLQQWRGLAWGLAALGFIIGAIIALSIQGVFFPDQHGVMAWIRGLALFAIPACLFFIGGAIGSNIESRRNRAVPVAA